MRAHEFVQQLEHQCGVTLEWRQLIESDLLLTRQSLKKRPQSEQRILRNVPVALLPTGDVNALAGFIRNGDAFVILEMGLLLYLETFNILFLAGIMLGNSKEFVITEERAQILVDATAALLKGGQVDELRNIEDALLTNLGSQKSTGSPAYRSAATSPRLRKLLLMSELCWIVGHEYGHIVLGHVGRLRNLALSNIPTLNVKEREQQDEFEADEFGLHFTTSWLDPTSLPTSKMELEQSADTEELFRIVFQLAAPDICGSLLRLVEYCHQLIDYYVAKIIGAAISDNLGKIVMKFFTENRISHPPARLRHERMRSLGPCNKHPAVLQIAQNTQIVIEQVMNWIYEDRISIHNMKDLVFDAVDRIPDNILLKEPLLNKLKAQI